MYQLQNCYCLDAMASCYLKGFPDPVRFHFQGGFSFLTLLRWAKHSFGPVAPPIDPLHNRAWSCTGHCSSVFSLSIIRTTTTAVSFTSILCACVYVDGCDWLGLQSGVPKPGGDGGYIPPNNLTVSPTMIWVWSTFASPPKIWLWCASERRSPPEFGEKSVPFSSVARGGVGGYRPYLIGQSTKMQNKENTTSLSFLRPWP